MVKSSLTEFSSVLKYSKVLKCKMHLLNVYGDCLCTFQMETERDGDYSLLHMLWGQLFKINVMVS